MRAILMASVLTLALVLGSCGKRGPPTAPGPQNEIIYPHSYPRQ